MSCAPTVAGGKVASQIRTGRLGEERTKYLVYGSPVPTKFGQVELYYLVPLTRQDATAADARATVVATGVGAGAPARRCSPAWSPGWW